MIIKVLGSGCKSCETLEQRTREALKGLNLEADIVKVTSFTEISSYGVMKTPALVVDEEVLFYGRVPEVEELKSLLS